MEGREGKGRGGKERGGRAGEGKEGEGKGRKGRGRKEEGKGGREGALEPPSKKSGYGPVVTLKSGSEVTRDHRK